MRIALVVLMTGLALDAVAGCLDGPDPISLLPEAQRTSLALGDFGSGYNGKRVGPTVQLRARLLLERGERWLSTREMIYEADMEELREELAELKRRLELATDPDVKADLRFEIEDKRAEIKSKRDDYETARQSCRDDMTTLRDAVRSAMAGGPVR